MKPGDIDILDLDQFDDGFPHDYFKVLRREDPVHFNPEPEGVGPGFYSITRYDDVRRISRTPALFSSERGGIQIRDSAPENLERMRSMMLNMDPPHHVKYRRLVQRGFTPKMVSTLEPIIRSSAREVVDAVAQKGECDFVRDLASELPLIMICELLGVPREDRAKVFDWSNRLIGFDDPEYAKNNTENDPNQGMSAAAEMWVYANGLAEQKKSNPDDTLVSKLINGEVEGEKLSELEFNNFFLLLSVAGNETSRTQTAHGMRLLFEHPEQRERLMNDLSLLPTAIEEMLRYNPPVMHFRRTVMDETEVRGVRLERDDKIALWYPSANRDEDVFEDADTFDVTRDPNPHVSFGLGEHFCLGANLARMQIHAIFHEILTRLPDLEPAGPVRLLRGNFVDGVKEMRVRFTPEAS